MSRVAWFSFTLSLVIIALVPSALAAPVRLAKYDFIVAGQEAATGDFLVPPGRNRAIVITVHARTDTGPTADFVTVDWARLNGDAAQPLTQGRRAIRSVAPMHQSTTLLYRHIDNSVSGNHNVLIRMANNLVENKVVHVHVMGNIDSGYNPVSGDTSGSHTIGSGVQAIGNLAADADFVVMEAATHNSGPAATVTGRAPAAKVWMQVNNASPSIKALTAFHVKTASGSAVYSYTMSLSDNWSIVMVRFRAAYTIAASAGPNGSVVPAGDVPVVSGGNQSFLVTADANYVISQLLVDGNPVAAAAGQETFAYDFTNVTSDRTIAAGFSGRPILTVDPAAVDHECSTTGYTAAMAMNGVSATDPEDGDITGSVIMSNVTFPLVAPGVYTILYNVTDSDNTPAIQKQRVVTVADTLAPDLTLNGTDMVLIECGWDTYVEPGAEAIDQCDGPINVLVSGDTVDETVIGAYVIDYTAVDAAGFSVSRSRTVHVQDTSGPVITLLAPSNPLILDGGADYLEAGATAWDACEGDLLPESIVIGGDAVNTSVIGSYAVTYTAVDSIGNASVETLNVVVQREACALVIEPVAANVSVVPGEQAILAVQQGPGSCAVGTLSYEWKKRNGNKEDGFSVIPGAPNEPTFIIPAATPEDSGVYRCDVSDDMYTVASPEITLTVATGLPAGGLGAIALAALAAAVSGALVLRKRK